MKVVICLVVLAVCLLQTSGAEAHLEANSTQQWGYVTVRPGAHMFWWLYRSTATDWDKLPLVMWLQGGPGASGTGFGNFVEIGPLDINLQPRNTTWLQAANLLFVDNPVGTGYSYVDKMDDLTTDVAQISADLLTLLTEFFKAVPDYNAMPFYIFSESYGGKMTADFGKVLHQAISAGTISCNFKAVALGDSWVSPLDSVTSWGPVLYANSLINAYQLNDLNTMSAVVAAALKDGQYTTASDEWSKMEDYIDEHTDHVDIYNFIVHGDNQVDLSFNPGDLSKEELARRKAMSRHLLKADPLSELMNGKIRDYLGVIPDNVTWGGQSEAVFEAQWVDFMKDVVADVDYLLTAGVEVVIYSGQLDIICAAQGTMAWIENLTWTGLKDFLVANRSPVYASDAHHSTSFTDGFVQMHSPLTYYWILNAGHMVPKDNGPMALKMLELVTSEN